MANVFLSSVLLLVGMHKKMSVKREFVTHCQQHLWTQQHVEKPCLKHLGMDVAWNRSLGRILRVVTLSCGALYVSSSRQSYYVLRGRLLAVGDQEDENTGVVSGIEQGTSNVDVIWTFNMREEKTLNVDQFSACSGYSCLF